jgi:2-polyprenyl-6-methoxyphenol hydroxylase-like FAD-dependent oxidoreductase
VTRGTLPILDPSTAATHAPRMQIAVVGAGVAGLGTSLMLGKAGHSVTLLERDPAPPADPEEAWATWERKGVPQARLAHVFLGRMRNLLRDEHPELYAELLAAGASEIVSYDLMPPAITDRERRPIDDDIVMLGVRRVVLEHHLRHAAAAAGVDIRSSAPVAKLVAGEPVRDGIPHVTGVVLEDGTILDADLVVDCGGRRSPLPRWLDELGAHAPPEQVTEDGLMYFGRYYRLNEGQSFPQHGPPLTDVGYLFALTFEADDGWFAIALAVHSEDKAMRTLRDNDVFERALQALPATAVWRTPGLSTPMSDVSSMSGIDDRWRDIVVDGAPLVTGLVAVGDSLVATNPAFGRGSSLAWICGRALVDVIAKHGDDLVAHALAQHEQTSALVRVWYDQQVSMDSTRLEGMRRILAGEPPPGADPTDPMATIPIGLALASGSDADVFRAMGKIVHMLEDPMVILGDPTVFTKAIEAYEARGSAPGLGDAGPTRVELVAALATEGTPAAVG